MGLVGGHPVELTRAAARLRPVTGDVGALAGSVRSVCRDAEAGAGDPRVAAASGELAACIASAASDTALVLGHPGEVAELSATGLRDAGGGS
jgi:hypothetical protein